MAKRFGPSMKQATAALLAMAFLSAAAQAEDVWRRGGAQGLSESWVENGPGNRIFITCEDDNREATEISLSLVGKPPPPRSTVLFVFNDLTTVDVTVDEQGSITSACHACGDNFDHLLEFLKSRSAVYVWFADRKGSRFSLKGSTTAIGDCRSDWAQSAGD